MKSTLYSILMIFISLSMLGFVLYTVYPCFDSNTPSTVSARVDELIREIPVDETSDVKFIKVSYEIGLHKYRKTLSHEHYYTGLDVGDTIEVSHHKKSLSDFSTAMRVELVLLSIGGVIIMAYAVSGMVSTTRKSRRYDISKTEEIKEYILNELANFDISEENISKIFFNDKLNCMGTFVYFKNNKYFLKYIGLREAECSEYSFDKKEELLEMLRNEFV